MIRGQNRSSLSRNRSRTAPETEAATSVTGVTAEAATPETGAAPEAAAPETGVTSGADAPETGATANHNHNRIYLILALLETQSRKK